MNALTLARVLQDLLCERMDAWNLGHADLDPLRKMPWDNLDPVSRELYLQRAEEFLKRFAVTPAPDPGPEEHR